MSENIPLTLIVNGEFKNMVIPVEMVSDLAERLRKEGVCAVHTSIETYTCEGIVVVAKGSKNKFMVFTDK